MKNIALALALLLAACQQPAPPVARSVPPAAVPQITKFALEEGTMMVVSVPTVGMPRIAEFQTCFIWRDTNGSAMQCPNDRQSYTLDPPDR